MKFVRIIEGYDLKEYFHIERIDEDVFSKTVPGEITIYTLMDKDKEYKKICFNKCGVAVDLEKAISLYVIKRATSLFPFEDG